MWVFQAFSFDRARISDLDISYSNNINIIVLDTEAVEKTLSTGMLHLKCCWRETCTENGHISYLHKEGLFNFDQLKKDFDQSQIYCHNFAFEDRKAKQKLFTELWSTGDISQYDNEKAAQVIKTCYGINLKEKGNLARLIHLVWVARTGKPSGWSYTPEQVFHKLFDSYKDFIFIYIVACQIYRRTLPDKKGLIAVKTTQVINSLSSATVADPSPYYPKREFINIICKIFPTLHEELINRLNIMCIN